MALSCRHVPFGLWFALLGCQHRDSPTVAPSDAGAVAISDAGTTDAGYVSPYGSCPADAGPVSVEEGGLVWSSEVLPTVTRPQDAGWVTLSTDPECGSLTPGPVPPRLTWDVADAGALPPACAPARVDGQGDVGVWWLNATGGTSSFLKADGTAANAVHDGNLTASSPESQWFSSGPDGFVLAIASAKPDCQFLSLLGRDGLPSGPAIQPGLTYGQSLWMLFPNPLGGWVEVRETTNGQTPPDNVGTLDVRFVDATLGPIGDWSNVITRRGKGYNDDWAVGVDQQGRALVLDFIFPPSFGPPPPPSDWTFMARWIGPSGPLSDAFTPIAPVFQPSSTDGYPLFAGWGIILPLPEGGFAMHQGQTPPSQGTISPSGWYAYYPSGVPGYMSAPGWLTSYHNGLSLLPGGVGYAAIQYNSMPGSCARTVVLVAPSGRACFELQLAATDSCTIAYVDTIWPDGTLVIQGDSPTPGDICRLDWWPGLARPAY